MILPTWIARWLDTDRRLNARDKKLHFLAGLLGCAFLDLCGAQDGDAVLLTIAGGAVYEAGQADIAQSEGLIGEPGYGFGLIDLGADTLGAIVWIGVKYLFRTSFGL